MDTINIFTTETFKYKKADVRFLSIDRTFVNMSFIINNELIQIQSSLNSRISLEIQLENIYQELVTNVIKYLKQ